MGKVIEMQQGNGDRRFSRGGGIHINTPFFQDHFHGPADLAAQLPPPQFVFRVRNKRLWLALRLRLARTRQSNQQFAEEELIPIMEKELAAEMAELPFIPETGQ
jgi:hypothetical protein